MRLIHSLSAFALALALAAAAADRPSRPLTPYLEDDFNARAAAQVADAAAANLAMHTARLNDCERRLTAAFANSPSSIFQRERAFKRLEMARELLRFISRNAVHGNVSGCLFAEQGLSDLKKFEEYFDLEIANFKNYPSLASSDTVTLNLRDFGALGDGVADDSAALKRAMAVVQKRAGKPTILKIPSGEYLLNTHDGDSHFPLFGYSNLLILGDGPQKTRIVFGSLDAHGIMVFKSTNVTVKGVELYWKKAPFAEGLIESVQVADASAVIRLNPLTTRPDDPTFARCGKEVTAGFTPEGKIDFSCAFQFYDYKLGVDDLGGGLFRVRFDPQIAHTTHAKLKTGHTLVIPARRDYYTAACMIAGSFCTFEDVFVRNSPTAAFTSSQTRYAAVVGCKIFPRDGCRLSTNADGFICSRGSFFAHCDFTHMLDDGHNPHSYGAYAASSDANSLIYSSRHTDLSSRAGDLLVAVRPKTGQYLANLLSLTDSEKTLWNGEQKLKVNFSRLPPNLRTFANCGLGNITREQQQKIVWGGIAAEKLPDQIFHPDVDGVGAIVTDCKISCLRGNAFSIQCSNALVENVDMQDLRTGVHLCALLQWTEGPAPYNVIVRGCTFKNMIRCLSSLCQLPDHGPAHSTPIHGIRWEHNRIDNPQNFSFELSNVSDADIVSNVLLGASAKIKLNLCENIRFRGNTLNAQPLHLSQLDISASSSVSCDQ